MTAGSIKAPTIIPLKKPEPGKPKSLIDIFTKIELSCETPEVDIYFSINGNKPDPEQVSKDKTTFHYKKPFTLPVGRRTVKAVSVTRDGSRQSNVVTKIFEVQWVETENNGLSMDKEDVYGFIKDSTLVSRGSFRKPKVTNESEMEKTGTSLSQSRVSFSASPSSEDKKAKKVESSTTSEKGISGTYSVTSSRPPPHQPRNGPLENATQVMRLQKSTDFLKCLQCMAPRPTDPFSRYCSNCGSSVPPLPQTRLPPPESGQLGMCVYCRNMVPMNLPNCIVCEMSLQQQNQPQSTIRLQERILCEACGTANPPQMTHCLTCESRLKDDLKRQIQMAQGGGEGSRSIQKDVNTQHICHICSRPSNNPDARFCDWCGAKAVDDALPSAQHQANIQSIACAYCSAVNNFHAKYCAQCGMVMRPPSTMPMTPAMAWGDFVGNSALPPMNMDERSLQHTSRVSVGGSKDPSLYFTHRRPTQRDVSCQTVGIFYPSSAKMKQRESEEEIKARLEKELRNRAPLLTAISPGKGYWRKQLDHVVAHLKSFTNNNPEFRTLLGEPHMGKLLSAQIREDNYEVNISLTFSLKSSPNLNLDYLDVDPYSSFRRVPRPSSGASRASSVHSNAYMSPPQYGFGGPGSATSSRNHRQHSELSLRHRTASLDSFRSDGDESLAGGSARRKKSKRRTFRRNSSQRTSKNYEINLSEQDKALLKEVGKSGSSRPEEIQQLIEEGANPNCLNVDGEPVLVVAVRHLHKDAVPALVQCGANIHIKYGPKGNTPLHEAVLLGSQAEEVIDALLGCGANAQLKNDRNESAFEMAVKNNLSTVISRMAARMGQTKLNELTKLNNVSPRDEETVLKN